MKSLKICFTVLVLFLINACMADIAPNNLEDSNQAESNIKTSDTTTLIWPDKAAFNFRDGKAISFDKALEKSDNIHEAFDITLEPWTYPGWCTNFIDMGKVSLDSLTSPPTSGYNDDELAYNSCEEVEEGHAYWIKTRNGKFAKVKVNLAEFIGASDEGNVNKVVFDWEYLGG